MRQDKSVLGTYEKKEGKRRTLREGKASFAISLIPCTRRVVCWT